MSSRRVLKVASAIREVVSMAILTDMKDPRVQDVTVTFVEVSGDLRQARVHVSVMGDETKQRLSVKGLQAAAGYLQAKLNDKVEMRYTPRLEFVLDKGVKHSLEVARILGEVLPRETTEGEYDPAGERGPVDDEVEADDDDDGDTEN